MMIDDIPYGKYRHYKNEKLYEVIGVARHTETLDEMVIYVALYDDTNGHHQVWARPREMFFEQVEHNGRSVQRFERVCKDAHT